MGSGPKLHADVFTVKGLDKSPSPLKYVVPSTMSNNQKTFGLSFENYKKVALHHDKQADRINPGPGTYLDNIYKPVLKKTHSA